VKPRLLLEDALIDVTNRGNIVIDCFAGSGSTLVAAGSQAGVAEQSNSTAPIATSSFAAGAR